MSLMSRRGDTRPPTFASNSVPLESMGVCRLSLALLVLLHPTLSLGHSVLSFSGGVSNSRAPSVDNDVAIEESMDVRYMKRTCHKGLTDCNTRTMIR